MEVERRPVVIVGPREVEPKRTTSFSIESILEKKEDKDEYKITPSAFRHCRAFQREPSLKCYNSALEYQEASQTCPSSPTCSYPCCTAFPSSSYGLCLQRDAYYRVHGALSRSLSSTMSYGASNFDPLSTYRFSGRGSLSPYSYSSYKRILIDERDDSKRKGGQVRFSHGQSVELERVFNHQKYISPQERKQLSRLLQLSERQITIDQSLMLSQHSNKATADIADISKMRINNSVVSNLVKKVKTWFQNRRAKWRRIKMEAEMKRRLARDCILREQLQKSSDRENTVKDSPFDRQDKDYYYSNKINGRKLQDFDVKELELSPEREV